MPILDANPINVTAIDHLVLRARDVDRLVAFYTDVLGCRVERVAAEGHLVQLRAGSALIDITDARGSSPTRDGRNLDHFCLRLEPWDEEAVIRHLRRHGVAVGEVVRRYGARGSGPSIYVADPEGNTVELKGPPTG